jgi:FXSXX-COOH protein
MREEEDALLRSELVDLTGVDFGRLAALPESVLAASLRRIFREASEDAEPIAGFHSAPPSARQPAGSGSNHWPDSASGDSAEDVR